MTDAPNLIPHFASAFPTDFPLYSSQVYPVLRVDRDTLRNRYNIGASDPIGREQLVNILQDQRSPSPRRKPETRENAESWLVALGVQFEFAEKSAVLPVKQQAVEAELKPQIQPKIAVLESAKPANPQTRKPANSESPSRLVALIEANPHEFAALLTAMIFQTYHSGMVAYRISGASQEWLKVLTAISGAIAIDAAAIMMTIHEKHSRKALQWFAVLQFLINLFYYRPWMDLFHPMTNEWIGFTATTVTNCLVTTLFSGVMAFVMYSYSEIFTTKKP